jgi:hypothetical protein
MIQDTSTEGFVGGAQAIQKLDFLGDARKVVAPTLLIVGQNDAGMLQPMHALREAINGARFETLANAGHLPQFDDVNKFNECCSIICTQTKPIADYSSRLQPSPSAVRKTDLPRPWALAHTHRPWCGNFPP